MVMENINYVLHAGIIGLITFLKPGLEPKLWPFSCCKPSPSPIQACRWAGVGWALGPAQHITRSRPVEIVEIVEICRWGIGG
jgi:hypothetical protein